MWPDYLRSETLSALQQVPEGFLPVETTGPFMATLGPLYYRPVEGGVIIALRIAEQHLNRRGIAHGASSGQAASLP